MSRRKIWAPEPDGIDVALYRIKRDPCMTEAESIALGARGFWWARNESGLFVHIWPRVRGSEPLDIEVSPAVYTIGVGSPEHYRETLDLLAPPGKAPCAIPLCSGVVPFTVEAELGRFDDGGLPPRSRLCSACSGEVSP